LPAEEASIRGLSAAGILGCNEAAGRSHARAEFLSRIPAARERPDAHWRETTFDTELMTGFSEAPGIAVPMSTMTIQSLADIGYVVNTFAADPYIVPPAPALQGIRANVMEGESIPNGRRGSSGDRTHSGWCIRQLIIQ
jgi:hypothetical protein